MSNANRLRKRYVTRDISGDCECCRATGADR